MSKAKALVLEEFNNPLQIMEFPLPVPGKGEVLARITAAGICGSDLHMYHGSDPRTPLPIIPGHEGVGEIVDAGDGATLQDGEPLLEGMPVVWERSLTCGKCYFCVRNQEYLCVKRKIYGINISSENPPHLSGNYATHILLRKGTKIYPRDPEFDPATLVPATCSGTTAAHAHEQAEIKPGDKIVIYGSGPVAMFQTAFAYEAGAEWVIIITRQPGPKARMASEFGTKAVLFRDSMDSETIIENINTRTENIGVDAVIDTAPDPANFTEAVKLLRRGGTYVNPGLAVPSEPVPVEFYSEVVNKNITIRGTWASDAGHLRSSIELVQSGKYPFDKLVTHRFGLGEFDEAWKVLTGKEGVKIVFEP